MKQTAVEWFIQEFEKEPTKANLDRLNGQAKEMEKQQQGYSESDMTNYALYILHNDVITPKEWFEQIKKK